MFFTPMNAIAFREACVFLSLTAVVFALQDGGVEVFGRPAVRGGGGQHCGVVPLSRLHRARLVT